LFEKSETTLSSPEQLAILDFSAQLASDLVSDYFQLDFSNFKQWPVDIRHYPTLETSEIRSDVLAQLLRYRRRDVDGKLMGRDFWRICL
jgi:hypothetical protein